MKKIKKRNGGQIALNMFLALLSFITLYPLLLIVSASFTEESELIRNGYRLIPDRFSLAGYQYVLKNPITMINAYKTTTIFSVLGTIGLLIMTCLCAYPLSKKEFKPRKFINFYLYFTMLFSGGMVPSYILNTQVWHLGNTIWVYIIPSLMGAYYVFMLRTFMSSIPNEVYESVMLDGGSEYMYLFRFAIPLSKPALATIAITVFLAKWQDWMTSLLYITDHELMSLQYYLQEIMENLQMLRDDPNNKMYMSGQEIPSESVRMAMAVVVAGPVLFIFPFFQKYFQKGMVVGSVKG